MLEDQSIYLQLRYAEGAVESGSEYAVDLFDEGEMIGTSPGKGAPPLTSIASERTIGSEGNSLKKEERQSLREKAREVASTTTGSWREVQKLVQVAAFEKNQERSRTRAQQMASVGFKASQSNLLMFNLNEQMQAYPYPCPYHRSPWHRSIGTDPVFGPASRPPPSLPLHYPHLRTNRTSPHPLSLPA